MKSILMVLICSVGLLLSSGAFALTCPASKPVLGPEGKNCWPTGTTFTKGPAGKYHIHQP